MSLKLKKSQDVVGNDLILLKHILNVSGKQYIFKKKTKRIRITHWEEWSRPSLGFRHGPSGEAQGLNVKGECCYTSALSCHFGQSNIPKIVWVYEDLIKY